MTKAEEVALISYKPGWKFSATEEKLTIEVRTVEDSRNFGEYVTLTFTWPWDESFYAVDFVWECIHRAELHEIAEWFRVDGRLTHDPHTTMKNEFEFHNLRTKEVSTV
jgi:hypothetical protein